MTRRQFATYSSVFTALLIAFIGGFPFLLYAGLKTTACAADTCGAAALVFALFGRIILVFVYAIAMLTLVARRCARAGLGVLWTLASLLWLLVARDVLLAGFNFWAAGFSLGILSFRFPVTLVFLFAFVIFLSFWKGEDENRASALTLPWRIAGISAFVSAIISAVVSIPLIASFGWIVGLPSGSGVELMFLMDRVLSLRVGQHWITYTSELWVLLVVFICALAYLIFDQRRADRRSMPSHPKPA
ncbi:hypothetical protein FHX08_004322 [Rhizobium sp. BK529]|uniref:hypothetical protein n=1 Tax=unclassified Rhizobium TaxID=2613769 RepID=UPI00104E7145|nr:MULTISPECIES: hypothetical protein [unclassified Rhizobium]MBB3593919.1 hypothetical protein [Rhizobium sp. BK529]TCS01376.1 hypothetical protein EV281_106121 [Rhizobium sp. BK418]